MAEITPLLKKRFVANLDALRNIFDNSIPDDNGVARTTMSYNQKLLDNLHKVIVEGYYSLGRRELSDELIDWINGKNSSQEINTFITDIIYINKKKYNEKHSRELCLAMVYQILTDNFFYRIGKNNTPIQINIKTYCGLVNMCIRTYYRNFHNTDFCSYSDNVSPQVKKTGKVFENLQQTILSKFG